MPNFFIASLCLLAGAFALEWVSQLPSLVELVAVAVVAGSAMCCRRIRLPALVLMGFCIMAIAVSLQLEQRLDPGLQSETIAVVITVSEFPVTRNGQVTLVVDLRRPAGLPARLRLSWQEPAFIPRIAETWRLDVRLRRPGGYANPGGFDYAGWLLRNRIGASGYVVPDGRNYRVYGTPESVIGRFRRAVVERLQSNLPADEATAVLNAVIVGARHEITPAQWDNYAATGTSHLMAISGLHIGLAAGAMFLFARLVLAVSPGRTNERDLALIAAVFAAVIYAAMSGFAVPARRACVMLIIGAWLVLRRHELAPSAVLGVTAVILFLLDPLTTLTPGFRMSFAAVAVLIAVARRHLVTNARGALSTLGSGVLRLGQVQTNLLTGLLPLTVLLFERVSIVAPLVNMAILPVFNVVTVPFALAGAVLNGPAAAAGDGLLQVAHLSVSFVLAIVAKATMADALSVRVSVPISPAVLFLPALHVLLPGGWPGRRLVLIAMVAVIVAKPAPVPDACFRYHVLDVGQGLAVVVQTRDKALLFDTGPAFRSGSNTVETVVLPFLRRAAIARLEVVIISHADLDHAGGVHALIGNVSVGRVMTGEILPSLGRAQAACAAGQRWEWNGVRFRVLHPRRHTPWENNNASCVVEISAGANRLLLTGDIEAPVETLLQHRRTWRRSHVVVVPHHGSRTSSSAALIDETTPAVAIVSAGTLNRWGFPKDDVVARWRAAGAVVISTGSAGAVSQQLCRHQPPRPPDTVRAGRRRKVWQEWPVDSL